MEHGLKEIHIMLDAMYAGPAEGHIDLNTMQRVMREHHPEIPTHEVYTAWRYWGPIADRWAARDRSN